MNTESKIQQSMVIWYRNNFCLKHHNPRHAIFSIPNESKSKMETLNKMAIGMMPGASDLLIVRPDEVIFVEVKTEIGRQSDKQKEFQSVVESLGFRYILVRSLEDFKAQVQCS